MLDLSEREMHHLRSLVRYEDLLGSVLGNKKAAVMYSGEIKSKRYFRLLNLGLVEIDGGVVTVTVLGRKQVDG